MILCCGTAVVEMVPAMAADGRPAFVAEPAGVALGTAIALGRLGSPVGFAGALSTDPFGAALVQALQAAHVDLSAAPRTSRPSPLAFVEPGGGLRLYAAGTAVEAAAALLPVPDATTALLLGGLALLHEPGATAWEARAADPGCGRVRVLDPNIRPALVADAAAFRARLRRLMALSDIVKLSEADLAWLAGPGDPLAAARGLRAEGRRPWLVVVTHGARGATGLTAAGAEVFVPAPSVTVADRRGAGEAFGAGLLAALHRAGRLSPDALAALTPAALRSALNLGVHAAALAVSRAGVNPPHAQELA